MISKIKGNKDLLYYILGIVLAVIGLWSLVFLLILLPLILLAMVFGGDTGHSLSIFTGLSVLALALFCAGVYVLIRLPLSPSRIVVTLASIIASGILLYAALPYLSSIPGQIAQSKPNDNSEIVWHRSFAEGGYDAVGNSALQTADGGYLISMTKSPSNGFRLIKTDESGAILWDYVYKAGRSSWGSAVQQTNDGDFIVCGTALNIAPKDTATWHLWLVKIDGKGNKVWEKLIDRGSWGFSVQQTKDNGYIACGRSVDHVYVARFDSYGNLSWDKELALQYMDLGEVVQQTADGGYIVGATTTPLGQGGTHPWLIKLDGQGNKSWDKTYTPVSDTVLLQQTADGGYILDTIGMLLRVDSHGAEMWQKPLDTRSNFLTTTSDGNYVCFGDVSDADHVGRLTKFDDAGKELWVKSFSMSPDYLFVTSSLNQTGDGGFVVGGRNIDGLEIIKIAPSK